MISEDMVRVFLRLNEEEGMTVKAETSREQRMPPSTNGRTGLLNSNETKHSAWRPRGDRQRYQPLLEAFAPSSQVPNQKKKNDGFLGHLLRSYQC